MSESKSIIEYDALEVSYRRDDAAPLVMSKPKFSIGDLLKDDDGDLVQVIGMEWNILDEHRDPHWKYVIWDIALGCVLGVSDLLLDSYTLSSKTLR
jgi:hypothetical protein